jgi:hypothetical protein
VTPNAPFRKSSEALFEFALAEALGMTVARMRAEMPSSEFSEWVAYHAVVKERRDREARRNRKRR